MKKNTKNKNDAPEAEQYEILRSAFSEVIRLAQMGAKQEVKGMPASKRKDSIMQKHLYCIGFIGSFLNGVDEQYKQENPDFRPGKKK